MWLDSLGRATRRALVLGRRLLADAAAPVTHLPTKLETVPQRKSRSARVPTKHGVAESLRSAALGARGVDAGVHRAAGGGGRPPVHGLGYMVEKRNVGVPGGRRKRPTATRAVVRETSSWSARVGVCVDVVSREGDFGPLDPDGPVQLAFL